MVESAAAAPEQYIAINTARGFMGNVGSGCWAFVEARERLDLFKVLSPPVSGTCFFCADVGRRFYASGF
jgi:hypothetical protein